MSKQTFIVSKIIMLFIVLIVLVFSYCFNLYNKIYKKEEHNKNIIYNNIYLDEFNLGGNSIEQVKNKIEYYKDYFVDKEVNFIVNGKDFKYKYKDLGIDVDINKTIDEVKTANEKINNKDIKLLNNNKKKIVLGYQFNFNEDVTKVMLDNIKKEVDVLKVDGHFNTNGGISYVDGVDGYSFNIDESLNKIRESYNKGIIDSEKIELVGEVVKRFGNETYKTIDTLTSSFSTVFMPNTPQRNTNLLTALRYINGTVVEAGDVFSYCAKAGPFNKAGYVFYYEFVGNGVCQIATTTYNAALLGGLSIVKRYPHKKKSLYVDGGLDATVASYGGGSCVDMQFKNTYKYPIYIKAYASGGKAFVEFWSNHDAKEGKTYKTESVQLGPRYFQSYLHTYQNGNEISRTLIANTYYVEE